MSGPAIWNRVRSAVECLIFGGEIRERLLVRLLGALHRSQFRREWELEEDLPHFFNQRWNGYELTYGNARTPYPFYRGFYVSQIIRSGDVLLDIGCGDGFFANSFYSRKCKHIDAIDVEASAIQTANTVNNSPNIRFCQLDAVEEPFPGDSYDIIVWDGAIGHFSPSVTGIVLGKIKKSLARGGIFVGSESLAEEGHDHLQFFQHPSDVAALFQSHFMYVWTTTAEYEIGNGIVRREVYWRCADEASRHQACEWNLEGTK